MGEMRVKKILFECAGTDIKSNIKALQRLLDQIEFPYKKGATVGLKLHWGEIGNLYFLSEKYAAVIVQWLKKNEVKPFIFDTTLLYSGGRRTGVDSLMTAYEHGYTPQNMGCPVVIGDGIGGMDVVKIKSGFFHFKDTVEVGSIINQAQGFIIFSHFKGHLGSGFGGAIKNLSMGFASRAQKQLMHSDAHPELNRSKCIRCGMCIDICPEKAVSWNENKFPIFDLDKCIGCAHCIAICPVAALKVFWRISHEAFQERLVETAAAVWNVIKNKSILINALINISSECDCMKGKNSIIADDVGFITGYDPFEIDAESLRLIGSEVFDRAHPDIPWRSQFEYAVKIGMADKNILNVIP
jgi:uncharacterized Fe-S center protein